MHVCKVFVSQKVTDDLWVDASVLVEFKVNVDVVTAKIRQKPEMCLTLLSLKRDICSDELWNFVGLAISFQYIQRFCKT